MSQTLLAIGALLIVTTFAITVQQRRAVTQRVIVHMEVQEMAGAIARESLEIIRSRAFDDAVVNGTATGTAADSAFFTYSGSQDHFPTGQGCQVFGAGADVCDDIDDYHKMQTGTREFTLGDETMTFEVDVEVEYVDDNLQRVDHRTFNKKVTVFVRDTYSVLSSPVQLSRVFSYDF